MYFDPNKLTGRHKFTKAVKLTSVGSEDGNLLWFVVLKDEVTAQRNYKHGFMLILVAPPIFDFLFMVVVLHKEQVGIKALQDSHLLHFTL